MKNIPQFVLHMTSEKVSRHLNLLPRIDVVAELLVTIIVILLNTLIDSLYSTCYNSQVNIFFPCSSLLTGLLALVRRVHQYKSTTLMFHKQERCMNCNKSLVGKVQMNCTYVRNGTSRCTFMDRYR